MKKPYLRGLKRLKAPNFDCVTSLQKIKTILLFNAKPIKNRFECQNAYAKK